MMTYSPDYDRLLQEVRALAADEAAAARELAVAGLAPRGRAAAAAGLLGIRARLSAALAGIADGQAGIARTWAAADAAPVAGYLILADALAHLERRLTGLREQALAPY